MEGFVAGFSEDRVSIPTHGVPPVYNGPKLKGIKLTFVLSITIQQKNVVPNVTLDWDSKD